MSRSARTAETGTVLLEMLVLGFAVLLVVIPALLTAVRLVDATALVQDVARDAAWWTARHGTRYPAAGDRVAIEMETQGTHVVARTSMRVVLIGVGGTDIAFTVTGSHEADAGPYRSGR